MAAATKDVRMDAQLNEEMDDFLHLHFPPDYAFCAIGAIFRIPRAPLSDAAFVAVYEDLATISVEEQSGLNGSIKDKIYFARRLFHHAMRVVDSEAMSHKVRFALNQRVPVFGGYTLSQAPWPFNGRHEIRHDVDLLISDRNSETPLCCIQVRDSEVEFKQAMARLVEESILVGKSYDLTKFVTVMTDLKTWMFQRISLDNIFAPERVTVKLDFDSQGNVDSASLRRLMETLHGFLLIARDIPAQSRR